ncbi:MAG TPA: FAD-dependent oxidoreductase [Anaerolineae bacterium]|nr:FAD-dependent oxidoreductase [Anaerolineae bacterium]
MSLKVLIVGGVAGGASAAARLRRLDEDAEIVLFEKDEHISFANCGLPYYIGKVIKERDNLLVQTPEGMRERFNIDVRVQCEVKRIIRDKKSIELYSHATGKTYCESYDKLVLSPGAAPFKPSIPGIEHPRVFTIRNIPDTDAIKEFVDQVTPERVVVVGAGFIGLEMAENLRRRGVNVTVVELADRILPALDFEMAALVNQHVLEKGVNIIRGSGVHTLHHEDEKTIVELTDGQRLHADMVILGLGVRPEVTLAKEAGLELGITGGIAVDEHLRTSDPDIYAVGDAVEVRDFVSGNPALIPLAGPANKQGRIVADNICARDEKYIATQGTAIIKVFDMAVAVTGLNESALQRHGVKYRKSLSHTSSHALYYPGSSGLSIKVLFDPDTGKLLGAQVVGGGGVDKTIDVLSVAIRAGMTIFDLEKLELSYAPPFSNAKTPINIAGYVASNMMRGDCEVLYWDDIEKIDHKNSLLVDVRTPFEFRMVGTIDGAINIPIDYLRSRLDELPKDKDIYVFCEIGLRAYIACRILMQKGYRVKNLSGGYKTYEAAHETLHNIIW